MIQVIKSKKLNNLATRAFFEQHFSFIENILYKLPVENQPYK